MARKQIAAVIIGPVESTIRQLSQYRTVTVGAAGEIKTWVSGTHYDRATVEAWRGKTVTKLLAQLGDDAVMDGDPERGMVMLRPKAPPILNLACARAPARGGRRRS